MVMVRGSLFLSGRGKNTNWCRNGIVLPRPWRRSAYAKYSADDRGGRGTFRVSRIVVIPLASPLQEERVEIRHNRPSALVGARQEHEFVPYTHCCASPVETIRVCQLFADHRCLPRKSSGVCGAHLPHTPTILGTNKPTDKEFVWGCLDCFKAAPWITGGAGVPAGAYSSLFQLLPQLFKHFVAQFAARVALF